MKKLVLVIISVLSINLYAVDKNECKKLFSSATYNFYLENSCGFDGHNSVSVRKVFGNKNCPSIFDDADMKRVTNKVLGDTYQKMNKIGRDKFCADNKVKYDELEKEYK